MYECTILREHTPPLAGVKRVCRQQHHAHSLSGEGPSPSDYVIVVFACKNSLLHYVGIHFLCRSSRHNRSYAFVEPIHGEINYVVADSKLGVLLNAAHPSTKRQQGIIEFGVYFEGFIME